MGEGKKISIIVPTYNEQENISPLIRRIDSSMRSYDIVYEIICIDDHSTDSTVSEICSLQNAYPLKLFMKQGNKGKSYSILEGISHAQFPLIAMIDADLQYPPESIPPMLEKSSTVDIVIGRRKNRMEGTFRRVVSKSFAYVFCKVLHNLPYDVQSGLKIFKKEICRRIDIHPTPWTFDMEFLLQARMAGYSIGEYDIDFAKRSAGVSKVSVLKSSLEIGLQALWLKIDEAKPIPERDDNKKKHNGFHFNGKKYMTYTSLHHSLSAMQSLTLLDKVFLLDSFFILCMLLLYDWHLTVVLIIGALTLLYISDLLFSTYLMYLASSEKNSQHTMSFPSDHDLPMYTILCPLYKEWQVIPQFIKAMQSLNYPKHKLQVILLLEQHDTQTIEKVRNFFLPPYFEMLIVPDSLPKTKPKACNYGLLHARGTYIVIYDAEDIPEPDQLLKCAAKFSSSPKDIACFQAKLNYFNPRQNILTRLFTAEYSLWFDHILPGLQTLNAPIPLGGTSNHFYTETLINLHGWDAFNVTEDCDLGIRLYKKGYKTRILDSTTYEEANSNVWNWINQRSRWIKGYMQTYLVHMRYPIELLKQMGIKGFLIFQLTVGGKIVTVLINPFLWIITIAYFAWRPMTGRLIESFFPPYIFYFGVTSFLVGNFLYLYSYMYATAARNFFDIVKYGFVIPFYWALMSVASWKSVYSLIVDPHYWAKTVHGLHLKKTPHLSTMRTGAMQAA